MDPAVRTPGSASLALDRAEPAASERNDRALAEGLARCTREAFEEVYRAHVGAVLEQLQRGLGYRAGASSGVVRVESAFEAEELAQETFVVFFQLCREGRFDAERPARPFLLRIAANLALRKRSRGRREVPSDLEALELEPTVTPDPEADERRRQLAAFLESCDDDDRSVVSLYFDEGRSQHDVATTLGWSRDQVYRALVRIRRSAERFFAKRRWSDEP